MTKNAKNGKKKKNMIKKKLKEMYPLLQLLKRVKKKNLNVILPHLNNDVFEALTLCICNCIHTKRFSKPTRRRLKQKLENHKNELRYLSKGVLNESDVVVTPRRKKKILSRNLKKPCLTEKIIGNIWPY